MEEEMDEEILNYFNIIEKEDEIKIKYIDKRINNITKDSNSSRILNNYLKNNLTTSITSLSINNCKKIFFLNNFKNNRFKK
jgi:hypothetical protein